MTSLDRFAQRYPFPLDDYQVKAMQALDAGESVLVAAPTGSGKTVVAEYAVERAIEHAADAIKASPVTTPTSAASASQRSDWVQCTRSAVHERAEGRKSADFVNHAAT